MLPTVKEFQYGAKVKDRILKLEMKVRFLLDKLETGE